jgi:hypothetical protein
MDSQYSYLYDNRELEPIGHTVDKATEYNGGFMLLGIIFLVVLVLGILPRKQK